MSGDGGSDKSGDRFDRSSVASLLKTGGGVLGQLVTASGDDYVDPAVERWVGQTLGPFRIARFIDRGGMALVFEARRCDGQFEQTVAVKLLHSADGTTVVQRFERERQLLATLEHPGIAHIVDSGVADGVPWLAMEYVDGRRIDSYCDQHALSIDARLRLFLRVAQAVQFAHGRLIVHRDIKPSNILVRSDGQPKLLDFGIAKAMVADDSVDLTGRDLLMTPAFASPEQVLGEPVGVATDVYQLGLLLYFLLTGTHAQSVARKSIGEIKDAVVDREPLRPSSLIETTGHDDQDAAAATARARGLSTQRLRKRLAGDLDAIVMRALEKRPGDRYPTVQQLIADIDNYREHRPISAQPQTGWYRTRRFLRRHRGGVTAAALTTCVLIAAVAAVGISWRQTLLAQRVALNEAEAARQVGDFVTNILAYADPGRAGGDNLTVAELLESSVEEADRMDRNLAVQARVFEIVARAYASLSLWEKAEAAAQKALSLREAEGRAEVAESLAILTHVAVTLGEFERAESFAQRALRETQLSAANRLTLATVRQELANAKFQAGDYVAQREELRQALALAEGAGAEESRLWRAEIYSALGMNALQLGEYETAESELTTALGLLGDRPSERTTKMYVLRSLGTLYGNLGDNTRALEMHSESLTLGRRVYGEESAHILGSLVMLGRALSFESRLDEAEGRLAEALAIAEKTIGSEHGNTARILYDYALILRRRGEFARAREMQTEALRIAEQFFGPEHSTTINQRRSLAALTADEGAFQEALEGLEAVLPDVRRVFGADHEITWETRFDQADLLIELGRSQDARGLLNELLRSAKQAPDNKLVQLEKIYRRLSRLDRLAGAPTIARANIERAIGVRQRSGTGTPWQSFWNLAELVQVVALTDPEEARARADELLRLVAGHADELTWEHHLRLAELAPTLVAIGLPEQATSRCRQALKAFVAHQDLPVADRVREHCLEFVDAGVSPEPVDQSAVDGDGVRAD